MIRFDQEEVDRLDKAQKEPEISEHEANLQAIAEYRMIDDTFLSAVFDGRIEETELLLRIILEREDIIVESVKAQFFFSNIYGHEI